MSKTSPVAIFITATALIGCASVDPNTTKANESNQEMGGLKEWTTDQKVNEKSILDDDAKSAAEKAKEEDICIPIGEGENCW